MLNAGIKLIFRYVRGDGVQRTSTVFLRREAVEFFRIGTKIWTERGVLLDSCEYAALQRSLDKLRVGRAGELNKIKKEKQIKKEK